MDGAQDAGFFHDSCEHGSYVAGCGLEVASGLVGTFELQSYKVTKLQGYNVAWGGWVLHGTDMGGRLSGSSAFAPRCQHQTAPAGAPRGLGERRRLFGAARAGAGEGLARVGAAENLRGKKERAPPRQAAEQKRRIH